MDDIANKLMSITKLVCVLIVGMTLFNVMRAAVTTTAALNSISRIGQSQPSSIAGGLSSSDIRNRTAELKAKMAPRSAVLGAATRLTVIGVAFDRRIRERLDGASAKGDGSKQMTDAQKIALAAPLTLTVDFATVSRSAAVVLTDESLDLNVKAKKPVNSYAMLGYESQTYPRVGNLAAGTLAGYKIGTTDYGPASHPIDLEDASSSARGRLPFTRRVGQTFLGSGPRCRIRAVSGSNRSLSRRQQMDLRRRAGHAHGYRRSCPRLRLLKRHGDVRRSHQ